MTEIFEICVDEVELSEFARGGELDIDLFGGSNCLLGDGESLKRRMDGNKLDVGLYKLEGF